jgi:hypothetical protein
MRFYAGIGSRETPKDILVWMESIAANLETMGYTLRSGGAAGADMAFENGVQDEINQRIYLPWHKFNQRKGIVMGSVPEYTRIAQQFHPAWSRLSPGARMLMTRNVAQVLGFWPEPQMSDFVICWTPEGKGGGGTGQAVRIAKANGIRVFDLAIEADGVELQKCMDGLSAFPR